MLNERLRHRDVHAIMRHMVADSMCHPTESQFAQVAGANNNSVVQVRQSKEVRSPFAGLDIFKGDIVNGFATGKRVLDVLEHLEAGGLDVDLLPSDTEHFH